MPELPDVQVFREYLEEHALHRAIETVSVRAEGMLEDVSEGTLRSALRGHALQETRRHGKHLFVRSGEERGRWVRVHFGMTASFRFYDEGEDEPAYTRLRLDFDDGHSLAWTCRRKLGRIGLVEDPGAWVEEKGLGPDPLSDGFGLADFRAVLEGRTGSVKGTLMNQDVLAGFGNLYTDEALFQADLHPEVSVAELGRDRVADVWRAGRRVLEKAIDYRADAERMPSTWLLPNREEGADCPRCDGTIRKIDVSGRSTCFCDEHQKRA